MLDIKCCVKCGTYSNLQEISQSGVNYQTERDVTIGLSREAMYRHGLKPFDVICYPCWVRFVLKEVVRLEEVRV